MIELTSSIPNADKKIFIRWFLKNYQLKRREGVWILNYLLTNETLLRHVRFIEEAHYCPRAIVMSTVETGGLPFRFYKGNMMTNDAEKAFHEIRLHPEQDTFIQLNFTNIPPNSHFIAVVEDNPYIPSNKPVRKLDRKIAEEIVKTSLFSHQENYLRKEIDLALDSGEKEQFFILTEQLKKLLKSTEEL